MSLRGKLQRFKSHIVSEGQSQDIIPPPASPNEGKPKLLKVPFEEEWKQIQAKPFYYEEEYAMVREVRYPLEFQHGRYAFKDIHPIVDQWNQAAYHHPLSTAGTSASDLIFFDTETTGLHGGTGNTIFLLGVGRIMQDQVVIRQYFLPGPESEVALYHGFLAEVGEMKNLVTYNGKAFDWPQVKTRHTLLRNLLPKLPAFGHYDLLHGARRLWKDQLESCRLSVIEQEILQVHRQEDTPGYMAPLLYFDFLRDKNPDIIKGVLHHNEWDVLSLITLYIHLSSLLLDLGTLSCSDQETYQMGRWFEQVGDLNRALYFYESRKEWLPSKLALASLYKKMKAVDKAIELWEQIAESQSPFLAEVYTELAKGYEHYYKDNEKALYYADQAYASWKLLRKNNPKDKAAYKKRIERLEKKYIY